MNSLKKNIHHRDTENTEIYNCKKTKLFLYHYRVKSLLCVLCASVVKICREFILRTGWA